MRLFINSILIMSVLFQAFGYSLILLDFSINKTYIAANLCEKKSTPLNKCKGKCHLKKQLAKQENQSHFPIGKTNNSVEMELFHELNIFEFHKIINGILMSFNYQHIFTQTKANKVFRPPIA